MSAHAKKSVLVLFFFQFLSGLTTNRKPAYAKLWRDKKEYYCKFENGLYGNCFHIWVFKHGSFSCKYHVWYTQSRKSLYNKIQHSLAQDSTAQHSTAQHSTYNPAQHNTPQNSTAQHNTVQRNPTQQNNKTQRKHNTTKRKHKIILRIPNFQVLNLTRNKICLQKFSSTI